MTKFQLSQHRSENHCSNLFTTSQVLTLGLPCTLEFFCLCTTTSKSNSVSRGAGKATKLWTNSCVCSSTLRTHLQRSMLRGAGKTTWLGSDPSSPPCSPSLAAEAEPRARLHSRRSKRPPSRAVAKAQRPRVFLTLVCLPDIRESWNGWVGLESSASATSCHGRGTLH